MREMQLMPPTPQSLVDGLGNPAIAVHCAAGLYRIERTALRLTALRKVSADTDSLDRRSLHEYLVVFAPEVAKEFESKD